MFPLVPPIPRVGRSRRGVVLNSDCASGLPLLMFGPPLDQSQQLALELTHPEACQIDVLRRRVSSRVYAVRNY